jgi:hypothetical protein
MPMTWRGKIFVGILCVIPIIFIGIVITGIYFCTALLEGTNKTERTFIGCYLKTSGDSVITDRFVLPDQNKVFWDSIHPNDSIFTVIRYGHTHKEYTYEYRDQIVPLRVEYKIANYLLMHFLRLKEGYYGIGNNTERHQH